MDWLKYPSLIVLIIANLVPLYGVYALGWSVAELMLLYWTESAIIGFFNIPKMALAKGLPSDFEPAVSSVFWASPKGSDLQSMAWFMESAIKVFYIFFFILHYGGFMLGHLFFIVTLFIKDFSPNLFFAVLLGSVSLFVSHGLSFFLNYVGNKECLKADAKTVMFAPYYRIMLMHVAIIFGAVVGAPAVILIVGKTIIDAFSHLKERESYL